MHRQPKNKPLYSFLDADLGWEGGKKRTVAGSRAWDLAWVSNENQQLLEVETEESDESVRPHEDDSDDGSEDGTDFPDLAKIPIPAKLLEEKGSCEQGMEDGSKEGSEKGIEKSFSC